MTKSRILSESFRPVSYRLDLSGNSATLVIVGKKVGRPSKRITLHQKGLQVTSAKLWRLEKGAEQEIAISRINHHKSFEEVRLHSNQQIFPGSYRLEVRYILGNTIGSSAKPSRELMPSVDEPSTWQTASLELKS